MLPFVNHDAKMLVVRMHGQVKYMNKVI